MHSDLTIALREISLQKASSQGRDHLNPPYGGELVNLIATAGRLVEVQTESRRWPSWDLATRQLCDLELLLNGALSPLRSFMLRADYEGTCSRMRLANGIVWPIPIVLDVTEEFARTIGSGSSIALRDPEGVMLAALHVEEVWKPDRRAEAEAVYGTTNRRHSEVNYLFEFIHPWYISGRLEGIQFPTHYDFRTLRLTPSDLRAEFDRLGWRRIVGFQTQDMMHRAHQELTIRAALQIQANLLVHPSVGMAEASDVGYYIRVRCYQALLSTYPKDTAKLALVPVAMRMGGPREAVWHAIIRKNCGCSHFIVGRDHAGPGNDENGKPFYSPYAAQELLATYENEIGITAVPVQTLVYLEHHDSYVPEDEVPNGVKPLKISGAEMRVHLAQGGEIPTWFTFPEIARELQSHYPPRHKQGFCVFFTGLSGSGKSTIANVLLLKLLEMGGRRITLLDGDIVRKHLSSELGFSREHRDINIRRIGFVASEIARNGGIAICAPIAPYDAVRKQVRAMIQPDAGFILVYLSTPLEICESRDRKGLYAKARSGLVQHFTGISDPYEVPEDADIVVDTSKVTPEEVAQKIYLHLERENYIVANSQHSSQNSSYMKWDLKSVNSAREL
jgi:sulfate adenylyltransferase